MKYLKYIISIIYLFSAGEIYAQNTLSGNVNDKNTQEPLAGVSIYLSDLKKGVISDVNGDYEISNLRSGIYLLRVSIVGYKPRALLLEIKNDTLLNFSLEQSATELNEIIVTGVTRSTELKRNPVIVKAIDRNLFYQSSSTNLVDALKSIPGVNEITTGPNISKPIIRGLGFNRVITLNNGMKQEGQQWGDEHGIEIDEYSVDRVEIVKGPGSLMYGSDGIAGVLNFLPPKPPAVGEVKTQLISDYQSNNNLLGYSFSNSGNKNDFQWFGNFSNKFAGNYKNRYDGKVYNSGFTEYNGKLSAGINKNWGHSLLTLNSYNTKLGIVEGERDDDGRFIFEDERGEEITASDVDLKGYNVGVPYQKINHLSLVSNNYFLLKKGAVFADLGFQNNKRKEFEEAGDPDEAGLFLSLNTFNYNVRYNLGYSNGWETSFGVGGMLQSNNNKGEEFLIPDYNLFDIGVFAYTQKSYDKLTLAGGLRFDQRSLKSVTLYLNSDERPSVVSEADSWLKFAGISRNYLGISGSLGLTYQTSERSTLKLNLSQGFRAPNVAELSSNGIHEGTFRYEIGNADLKSEVSHQIDLAYYLSTEHLTLEVSPFINYISNYIFLEKLQEDNYGDIASGNYSSFQYISGNAGLMGGEIYVDWHPHPLDWLHFENSFSFVQGNQNNQTEDKKYLPYMPAPHYLSSIKTEFKEIHNKISNFYLKFNIDYYFAQNKVYSAYETESETPGYMLLSAGIGASIKGNNKKDFLNLFLSGNNLADKAYQNHLSRLKYADENPVTGRKGIFDMGRNISLKAIFNF